MIAASMNALPSSTISWYSKLSHSGPMADAFPDHLARLLTSSIETEERLDVLCLLKRGRPRTFTTKSVAFELGIASTKAENALAMLCGRGFLTVNIANDLFYSYAPVSPTIDKALDELEQILAQDRERVIDVLKKQHGRDPAHAFANAFLVRKKDDDG
jgi:predicted DNA-binding transcriptional regulator